MEIILCAAIHFDDDKDYKHQPFNIRTGVVVSGHRHCSIFESVSLGHDDNTVMARIKRGVKHETQGFLTNKNRFVSREEAFIIAKNAGQIRDLQKTYNEKLYSENLY